MPGYKRGIFLINKKFQFRFSMYVCSWLVAVSFVYPVIIYNLIEFANRLTTSPAATATLQSLKVEMLWLLILFQVSLILLTFLISIFISHRIAGPIYKLSKAFGAVTRGELNDELQFRAKDHFRDVADDFNIMVRGLRQNIEKSSDAILTAIAKLEKIAPTAAPAAQAEIEATLAVLREARD